MKKLLLSTIIIGTALYADPKPFIGANITNTGGQATANYQDSNVERTKGYDIKMGIEDSLYRIYADFGKVAWDNSTAKTNILVGDLAFPVGKPLGTKEDMKFYMGIHYGKINFRTDLTNNDSNSADIYGIQMGILSPCVLNENIKLELGFRSSKTSVTTNTSSYTHELTSLTSLILGLNYSF